MKKNTNTKTSTKFLTGALVGAVLGAAAGMFAASKTGKKLGKNIKSSSADFYKFISPKLKKLSILTEEEYNKFIQNAVVEFNKNKKLTKAELDELIEDAKGYWKLLKKNF